MLKMNKESRRTLRQALGALRQAQDGIIEALTYELGACVADTIAQRAYEDVSEALRIMEQWRPED